MRAIRLEGVGELALREVEKPVPGAGELLVRVEACGICGTDRHLFHGEFPSAPPVTLGHEFAGTVEAVGPGVANFRPGMRLTVEDLVAGESGVLPGGADLVVEAAGVRETVEQGPRLAASGGRMLLLGVLPQGEKVAIEPFDLLFREGQLLTSFVNPFTHARAAAMIASGAILVEPLVTRRIGLDAGVEAISAKPPGGEIRAIVVP